MSITRAALTVAVASVIALLTTVACGQDADAPSAAMPPEEAFQKVTPSDRVFTVDDLVAAGFRKSKEYDVEGLTAATAAWFGWLSFGGADPIDSEVRFYRSHEEAVEYGTPFAEEASGKDAIINSQDATWEEDVRDRRKVIGGKELGNYGSGAAAKYADYTIFANMVMFCEGMSVEQSLERCAAVIAALPE